MSEMCIIKPDCTIVINLHIACFIEFYILLLSFSTQNLEIQKYKLIF